MKMQIPSWIDDHMREILRGFSYAFAIRLSGMVLGFLVGIWIARMLGAQGAGLLALASTCVGIAAIAGRLGLDNALLRFVAEATTAGSHGRAAGASRKGLILGTGASVAATIIVYVLSEQLANSVFNAPLLAPPLKLLSLTIVPTTLIALYGQLLQSLKLAGLATFIQTNSVTVLRICGFTLIVATGMTAITIEVVMVVTIISSVLSAVAGWYLWRRFAPHIISAVPVFSSRELLGTSLPLLWVASMDLLIGWTDTLMLGIFTDSSSVGIYSVASRTATLASLFLIAANTITSPKFAAFHSVGDFVNLQRIAQISARLVTLVTLPVLLTFMLAPSHVLSIFGPEFRAGGTALAILSIGQLVNLVSGSVVFLLVMTGHQKSVSRAITVAAAGNLILNYLLIPPLGYLGACIATAISMSAINIALAWVVWRKLGIVSAVFPTRRLTIPETAQ